MMEKILFYMQKKEVVWAAGIFVFFFLFLILIRSVCRKRRAKDILNKETESEIGLETDSVSIGKEGEALVASILGEIPSKHKKLIHDIVLKNHAEKTTQIDHILINESGIFVIETKNYKGVVYGTEEGLYWYQYLNRKKYNFYNPIRQNEIHIRRLKEILGDAYPYHSIVVFVKNDLKKVDFENVIQAENLAQYILSYEEKHLSRSDVKKIYKTLSSIQKKKYFHIFHQEDVA